MRFLATSIVLASFLMGVAAAPASAQASEGRITINFTPAFATIGGDTGLALAGSVGYRFTDHLWFEGDVTWLDATTGGGRDFGYPLGFGQLTAGGVIGNVTGGVVGGVIGNVTELVSVNAGRLGGFDARSLRLPIRPIPIEGFGANDGQTFIGTLGLRYEPAVQTARFRPYVSGGLGLNHSEQELTLWLATVPGVPGFDESVSHSGFAFSAGGGANIRLFSALWANADVKYFRLSRDRNVMRLGGGVGLRF